MILRNSIANFFGQFLTPILSILLVPFYLRYLGLEGYGLIGFFSMLVTVLGIFTKGLGSALQREVALRNSNISEQKTLRRLVHTFELIYWVFGVLLALVLFFMTKLIAKHWLKVDSISYNSLFFCVVAISITLALAFPSSIYGAVFIGMQRQVWGNILSAIGAVFGAILNIIAILVWKSVLAFYVAGAINALINISILRIGMRRILPSSKNSMRETFYWRDFATIKALAVGLIWTNGIGLLILQLDRIFISKMLPISQLGIYTAAVISGRILSMFTTPILNATFPHICELGHNKKDAEFILFLKNNLAAISIIALTTGLSISFFAKEILSIWTKNSIIVDSGAAVMSLFVYGNILQIGGGVFYQAHLAMGITRFGVWSQGLALIFYPLLLGTSITRMGLIGAAWAWVAFGLYYFIFMSGSFFKIFGFHYYKSFLFVILKSIIISFPIIWGSRYLAFFLFSNSLNLRLITGGFGALLSLSIGYIALFGFRLPTELQRIFRTSKQTFGNNDSNIGIE